MSHLNRVCTNLRQRSVRYVFPVQACWVDQVVQAGSYHRIEKRCLGEEARKKVNLGIMSDN